MYYSEKDGFTTEQVSDKQVYVYDKDYQSILADLQNGAYIVLNAQGYPSTKFRPIFYHVSTGFTENRMNDAQFELTYEYWSELIVGQANGRVISQDSKGYPILVDPAPPTPADYLAEANRKKTYLLAQATVAINPLQDAVDLDDATDEEVALLKKWKQFRVAINRVDTSTAPNITWPEPPVSIPAQGTSGRAEQTEEAV